MKPVRQLSAATILCLTIAVSVLAGQIETPGATAPASTTPSITTTVVLAVVSLIYR